MDFMTAQISIRANIEQLKTDLDIARKEVYRTVDKMSERAAKGDVDKLAKRSALINARTIKDQLRAENELLRSLRAREVQNNRIAREHRRAVNEMVSDLERYGRQGLIAGAAMTAGLAYSVKQFADAEKQVRQAIATTDVFPDNSRYDALYAGAEDLAIRLNVPIREISRALEVLKVSGLSVEEQLKTLPTLVTLAKGSVTGTGIVADKIFDLMNAFDLELKYLDNTSNSLAYAATHARTTLSDLMDGLLAVGTVAHNQGNSFEQMAAVIMFMADAGIKGSQAGMALRRTLFNLANEESKATKALREYVDIYDPLTQQIKPLYQIFNELIDAMKGVDAQTRDTVLSHLFEQRAVTGGLAVFKAGSKGILEYADKLQNAGTAAQNLADYQLGGLSEQLGILNQQLQAIVRRIGGSFVPLLRSMNTAIQPWMSSLREWMDLNPQLVQGLALATAGMTTLLVSTSAMGLTLEFVRVVISPLISMFKVFGVTAMAAMGPWPILVLSGVAAVYALRAAWNYGSDDIKKRLQWLGDQFKITFDWISNSIIGKFVSWIYNTFVDAFKIIGAGWKDFFAEIIGLVVANLKTIQFTFTRWKESMGKIFSEGPIDAQKYWFSSLREIPEQWAQGFLEGSEMGKQKLTEFGNMVVDGFEITGVYLKAYGEATGENIKDMWSAIKQQFAADFEALTGMLERKFPEFAGLLDKYKSQVLAGVPAGPPKPSDLGKMSEGSLSNWKMGLRQYYDDIIKWNSFVQDSVKSTAVSIESSFADTFARIGDAGQSFKSVINDMFRSIGEEVRKLMGQFAARTFMRFTIEHAFPDLAKQLIGDKPFDASAMQLSSAGFQLQTSAGALTAAAGTLSAAAGAQLGSSSGDILGLLGGGGAGGFSWAGTNSAAGISTPTATGTMIAHSGGRVGYDSFPTRMMSTALFDHAPRLHNGLKLKSDEFPAVLQKGEEVKSKKDVDSERSSSRQPVVNDNRLRIINLLDPSLVRDYLKSPEGERVIVNVMRRGQYGV